MNKLPLLITIAALALTGCWTPASNTTAQASASSITAIQSISFQVAPPAPVFAMADTNLDLRAAAELLHKAAAEQSAGNSNRLVLPGLVADSQTKAVHLLAEATGLKAKEFVEFFLINNQNSGHDYESFAVSFADAGDIHKALEFAGAKPGTPVNPAETRFWPKGDRIIVRVHSRSGNPAPVRLEKFLVDDRTGKPLPEAGFVFAGSRRIRKDNDDNDYYAASARGPGSIISNYNEPETVLDVPFLAGKDTTYSHITPNPDLIPAKGEILELVLEPESRYGIHRNMDVTMTLSEAGKPGTILASVQDSPGQILTKNNSLTDALTTLEQLVKKGMEVFAAVSFEGSLSLGNAARLSSVLKELERPDGLRIEPPFKGQLYYKAFSPPAEFLERQERISHPWEIRIRSNGVVLSGTASICDTHWGEDGAAPVINVKDYTAASGEELKTWFDKINSERKAAGKDHVIPVLLVVGEPGMLLKDVMSFLKPLLAEIKTVHIYAGEPEK
jgi:hypothetical protein